MISFTAAVRLLAIQNFTSIVRRFGDPILELGAGTGRVLIPLAEAGHDVTGMDLSAPMLRVARAKIQKRPEIRARIRLVEGDMTDFDLGRRFALVLVPARAFQHLVTPIDQRSALNSIHRHLISGGHLVLDLFDPRFELLFTQQSSELPVREARDPRSGHLIRRTVVARQHDPLRQIVTETLRFEQLDATSTTIATEETTWSLRWTVRQEMAYLLELCGFEPLEQFSDFKGSPPVYGQAQLWVAQAVNRKHG